MRNTLPVKKKCQFDADIQKNYRASACGPVTAYTILDYYRPNHFSNINDLYRKLDCTPIGLCSNRFIKNMKKLLGNQWVIQPCTVHEMMAEIDAGRPVAAKFDKWFSFRWFQNFTFDYHWVVIVGYQKTANDLLLFLDDHGSPNHKSETRAVSFQLNQPILSFIKIAPQKTK